MSQALRCCAESTHTFGGERFGARRPKHRKHQTFGAGDQTQQQLNAEQNISVYFETKQSKSLTQPNTLSLPLLITARSEGEREPDSTRPKARARRRAGKECRQKGRKEWGVSLGLFICVRCGCSALLLGQIFEQKLFGVFAHNQPHFFRREFADIQQRLSEHKQVRGVEWHLHAAAESKS
jgi:hypothetical protein